MDLNKLFSTDKEKKEVISHLESLRRSSDWKFFTERIIQEDINTISEEILNFRLDNNEDRKKEGDMKRRRNYMIIMSQLPEKIIKALEDGVADVPDFDPYYKDIEEVKKDEKKGKV